jgi:hypothetical protein
MAKSQREKEAERIKKNEMFYSNLYDLKKDIVISDYNKKQTISDILLQNINKLFYTQEQIIRIGHFYSTYIKPNYSKYMINIKFIRQKFNNSDKYITMFVKPEFREQIENEADKIKHIVNFLKIFGHEFNQIDNTIQIMPNIISYFDTIKYFEIIDKIANEQIRTYLLHYLFIYFKTLDNIEIRFISANKHANNHYNDIGDIQLNNYIVYLYNLYNNTYKYNINILINEHKYLTPIPKFDIFFNSINSLQRESLNIDNHFYLGAVIVKYANDETRDNDTYNFISYIFNTLNEEEQFFYYNDFSNFKTFMDKVEYMITEDYSKKRAQCINTEHFIKYVNMLSIKLIEQLIKDVTYNTINMLKDDTIYRLQKVEILGNSRILFVGDFHSSIYSLYTLISKNRDMFIIRDGIRTLTLKENCYIFFLGDIVDRGEYSIELLFFVIMLKLYNFNNIHIVRGNHEVYSTYQSYGLGEEMVKQFKDGDNNDINTIVRNLFNLLPTCIYLHTGETNKNGKVWYHLSHGAFDNKKVIFTYLKNNNKKNLIYKSDINNPYMWGDFHMRETKKYYIDPETGRGQFSIVMTQLYCNDNNIKCLITGHQDHANLCFMTNSKTKITENSVININGVNYKKDTSSEKQYDLYSINDGQKKNGKNEYNFTSAINTNSGLNNNRILAFTTSTAKISRKMCCDCWMVMDNKN